MCRPPCWLASRAILTRLCVRTWPDIPERRFPPCVRWPAAPATRSGIWWLSIPARRRSCANACATACDAERSAADEVVRAFVRERLPGYKCPKIIEFVAELPKTATGKIQHFKLR
ncbi:MAG: hypothetical protein IH793_06645 [Acidobacteria bacterium]|nr:hypothetical protein [Acidobacteriota bacterium]